MKMKFRILKLFQGPNSTNLFIPISGFIENIRKY